VRRPVGARGFLTHRDVAGRGRRDGDSRVRSDSRMMRPTDRPKGSRDEPGSCRLRSRCGSWFLVKLLHEVLERQGGAMGAGRLTDVQIEDIGKGFFA